MFRCDEGEKQEQPSVCPLDFVGRFVYLSHFPFPSRPLLSQGERAIREISLTYSVRATNRGLTSSNSTGHAAKSRAADPGQRPNTRRTTYALACPRL